MPSQNNQEKEPETDLEKEKVKDQAVTEDLEKKPATKKKKPAAKKNQTTKTPAKKKSTPKKKTDNNVAVQPLHIGVEVKIELEQGLVIAKVGIDSFREQDMNARVMGREKFHQLASNIKHRGIMESLPYCVATDNPDMVEIISGHHRLRATRQAGLTYAFVLLDYGLTRDQITAKQLAHNAIQGVDDKEMLKQRFDAIEDLEARIETALDPKDLEFEVPDRIPIPEMALGLEFKHVSMMFLPHQLKSFEQVIKRISGDEELIAAAPLELFEDFKKVVNEVQETENIVSIGTVIAFMTELTHKYLDEKRENASGDTEETGENGETGHEEEKVPEEES